MSAAALVVLPEAPSSLFPEQVRGHLCLPGLAGRVTGLPNTFVSLGTEALIHW